MNGEGEGTPIRFPAIAELEVSSLDRYPNDGEFILAITNNPTTSSDILFPAKQALLSGYFTRIALSEVQLQWRTPNITPKNNFVYWYDEGLDADFDIELPVNFYDLSGLGVALVANMNQAVGFPKYIVNLVNTVGTDFLEIQTNNGDHWGFQPYFPINPSPTTIRGQRFFQTAGITRQNFYQLFPNNSVQRFGLTTNLSYTPYIDVVSDRLAKFAKVKDGMTRQFQGQTAILARLYLTPFNTKEQYCGNHPFQMAIDYTTPKYIRWNPGEYINDFDLLLYDQFGELLWCDPVNYPEFVTEYQLTIQASET